MYVIFTSLSVLFFPFPNSHSVLNLLLHYRNRYETRNVTRDQRGLLHENGVSFICVSMGNNPKYISFWKTHHIGHRLRVGSRAEKRMFPLRLLVPPLLCVFTVSIISIHTSLSKISRSFFIGLITHN